MARYHTVHLVPLTCDRIVGKLIAKYYSFIDEMESRGIMEEWAAEANGEEEFQTDPSGAYVEAHTNLICIPAHNRIIAIANRIGISEKEYNFEYDGLLA